MTLLPPLTAAEPGYITEALRSTHVPDGPRVREVTVESSRTTIFSRITRLRLSYDGTAADAPMSLILKTGLPDRVGGGLHEVEFYRQVAPAMDPGLVPRCFDAHWDAATKDWHLLLEDLTDTHASVSVWPLPPTTEQCDRIVETLARFHAAWWDDPRLGASIGKRHDAPAHSRILQDLTTRFAGFADRLGDSLSSERRLLYERLFDVMPRQLERSRTRRNVTLLHGDAHVWNVFMPRDGGDLRLFDWDSWRIGVAATDLAYMMALHWYPDRRKRLEGRLLDRYHATLLAQGVHDYDRQALDDDYRRAVLWQIITPVWQATLDIPPVIWRNHLERVMLAVDDLGCRDLLP